MGVTNVKEIEMKKIFVALVVMLLLIGAMAACFGTSEPEETTYPAETEQPAPEETPVPAETPAVTPAPAEMPAPTPTPAETPTPTPPPTPEPEETAPERTVEEELTAFILRAEQVYRDIVLGDLFRWYWDEAAEDWIMSEYLEEAPPFWVYTPNWRPPGGYMMRWRVLPASGFTSIAELNAALHEYWGEDFEVRTNPGVTESIDFVEDDGGLYFFPAMASGIGTSFLGVLWEVTQIELLHQEGTRAVLRADAYLTSYGELYRGVLRWVIMDGRIATRSLEWGDFVLWRDAPHAIDAMVASGRWTEEQVLHDWESGWFERQEDWR